MKRKIIWAAAGGIAAVIILAGFYLNQGTPAATAMVEKGELKNYIAETGTVQCRDWQTVTLEGSGLIHSPLAEAGEQVKKGDVLLRLETLPLELELLSAEEQIKASRVDLQVREEEYETALQDYNNMQVLADAGAVSRWELAQKQRLMQTALAALESCRIKLEQSVLQREAVGLKLSKQELLAPADGVVLERKVEAAAVGVPGTVAYVIGDTSNMEIEVNILADDAYAVKPGNEVEITTRAAEQQVILGQVTKIAPAAVTVTSSLGVNQKKVAVAIVPLEQEESLKPGYEVDVRVITHKKEDALKAPVSAVFDYRGNSCVFLVQEGKAVLRAVRTGIQDEDFIEITEGLQEGDMVLAAPDNTIKEGMKIKTSFNQGGYFLGINIAINLQRDGF